MRCIVDSPAENRVCAARRVFACVAALVLAALFACLLTPASALAEPAVGPGESVTSSTGEAEASTTVSVYVDSFRILGQTPDLAGSAEELLNGPGSLQVTVAGGIAPYYYAWTRTIDGVGDAAFSDAGSLPDASSPITHEFTVGELVEGHEYEYVLSVTDSDKAAPQKVEARIRVVCSDAYGWRDGADDTDEELGDDGYPQVTEPLYFHDESSGADIKVAGYLHRSARIIVTPLDEFDPTRLALEMGAGSARVTGAWVIEVVFEGGAPDESVDPFVGDVHVSVRFPGQEAVRVASSNANVDGLRASVRVGETWNFPESVLFLGPDALTQRPDCTVDDAREWLSFATDVLGAFATLGEKTPGAGREVALDVRGGGSVVPAPDGEGHAWQVADGGTLRAVLLPDAGYRIGEVKASNGVPVSVSGNRVSLGPVNSDCTLSVVFEEVQADPTVRHTLTAEVVGGHGAVDPAEPMQVEHGQSALVQFLPDEGYVIDEVLVNGETVTPFADAYLVSAMVEDVRVTVSFRKGTPAPQAWFSVRADVVSGEGSVSPTAALVPMGGRASFSFLPAEGWRVADVRVNGESVGAPSAWTVEHVSADAVVTVAFEQVKDPDVDPDPGDDDATFTVNASSGEHGSISPAGDVTVRKGADAAFAFAPDTGYKVADVIVDGASVGAPTAYTLRDVQGNHTVHVEFKPAYDAQPGGSGGAGVQPGGAGPGSDLGSGGSATVKTGDVLGVAVGVAAVAAAAALVAIVVARRRSERRR